VIQDINFATIFAGVLPFIATDLIRLVILIAFPIIALWLPSRM
jgi:C4-dicarboxylate transporter, DctM subunit